MQNPIVNNFRYKQFWMKKIWSTIRVSRKLPFYTPSTICRVKELEVLFGNTDNKFLNAIPEIL